VAIPPAGLPSSIGLGEGLELNLRAYELRRSGHPLKLERIPMELLRLLVEQQGSLVTREQIVERIWGHDVFVDTDNSINGAVRKLRQALKDDPDRPRFIQTVSGLGYRYIAPVVETEPGTPAVEAPPEREAGSVDKAKRHGRSWLVAGIALALLAAIAAGIRWSGSAMRPVGDRVTLAVLPFENFTGDPTQEYFSDGLTEEMIARLGRLDPQRLGVIARTSVMGYKGRPAPLQRIGRELGVAYVLEGSVRRDARRVRVTVQLIQIRDQTSLWSREYDRDLSGLLVVQQEIAEAVASEIQLTIGDHGPTRIEVAALPPSTYKAYDLYLKGRFFWNKRTPDGFGRAAECFQQAIAADGGYARAHAGLADTYALMSSYNMGPPGDLMPKARTAALRALELDDGLAAAHTSLALIAENYDWDWKKAESEFQRAIALDPNYATAHHWYAEFLAFQGRFGPALAESDRARQLDPLSLIIAVDRASILYLARQYDRAIAQFQQVRDMQPDFPRTDLIILPYVEKGMFAEALAVLEGSRRARSESAEWALEAWIHGRAGHEAEFRRALRNLERVSRNKPVDPRAFLTAYVGTDKDRAMAALQQLVALRLNIVTTLKVDPTLDPLREDPRFQELLRRVDLAS
jgi:TolB-like protein/DNA-binding winged helix-turn-helix (wHTH) protein/Tfp pilus assembly protein PilF